MEPDTEPVDWDTPTRVTGRWVTVERSLQRKEDAVIATVAITVEADGPVTMEVRDDFPEEWPASEVGVHPRYVPADFVADVNYFEFTETVEPESPVEVVYGVKLESTESIQPPDPPVIQAERGLEDRQGPAEDPITADGMGSDMGPDDADDGGAPAKGAVEPEGASAGDQPPESAAAADTDDRPASRPPSPVGIDATAMRPTNAEVDATDPVASGRTGPTDAAADGGLGVVPDDGEEPHGAAELVDAFAAALSSGSASDEAVATLREVIGPTASKRDEVRLDHLQSRVEEVAAYTGGMGDLVDKHGPMVDVFDDYGARLDALEAGLDQAGDERDALRNRVDETAERAAAIDDIADGLEAAHDEIAQLRRDYRADIDAIEATLDSIEAALDDVNDGLASNVAALEARVEGWDETRRQLVDALAPRREPPQAD